MLAGAAVGPMFGGVLAGVLELGCRSPFVAVAALCGLATVHAYRHVPETAAAVLRRRRRTWEQARPRIILQLCGQVTKQMLRNTFIIPKSSV